jgi:hypothetical protein
MIYRRRIDYLPTPPEIAEACASIRASWTPLERRRRFVGFRGAEGFRPAWRPPLIDTSLLRYSSGRSSVEIAS